MLIYYLSVNM